MAADRTAGLSCPQQHAGQLSVAKAVPQALGTLELPGVHDATLPTCKLVVVDCCYCTGWLKGSIPGTAGTLRWGQRRTPDMDQSIVTGCSKVFHGSARKGSYRMQSCAGEAGNLAAELQQA